MPVTTMGSAQEQSIFDLPIKTHEQFTASITPRMLLSSPGLCTALSSALLCSGVPDNNCRTDTKGNPDGHQSLQDCWGGANASGWVPKPNREAKLCTGGGHSHFQHRGGRTSFWGPHWGVEDEIMNTDFPDKQTITHYSDTIRAEATAPQTAQNPSPSR